MAATRVEVNIPGEAPYDVRIGDEVLDGIGAWCQRTAALAYAPQVLVISDENVAPLYLARAKASLERAGFKVPDIVVPAGESSKSVEVVSELWEAMAALGLTRDCAVLALGGGVVGDLAGFAASTFMRGITVVQAPTTLLAMVDSSVGGKTGINLEAGKNLVGTFCQPSYVCASTDCLATLSEREWRCGCAEVAKSAVVDSDDFFFWLAENAPALMARDTEVATQAIARCVVFKADVVAQDKTESCGVRECLNYGHTLAHAIEKLSGYGTFSHGAAVAEGMRFAAALAHELVGASLDFVNAQADLLDALGLPRLPWTADPAAALDAMKRDKKARAGQVRFVLLRDVGDWEICEVDDDVILAQLQAWNASAPKEA
ncbi:3-dehydroquinate synthase [Adlercreutzia murintestinalis]|uniref:3-dehydroquinate synthase n=1 Tax=Adlercreutzia murintestinalis TaxID=2941325 RepID=UPI0020405F23|nr:3-dehydroquinate synthase [Adlercreutzia murintestinalis]